MLYVYAYVYTDVDAHVCAHVYTDVYAHEYTHARTHAPLAGISLVQQICGVRRRWRSCSRVIAAEIACRHRQRSRAMVRRRRRRRQPRRDGCVRARLLSVSASGGTHAMHAAQQPWYPCLRHRLTNMLIRVITPSVLHGAVPLWLLANNGSIHKQDRTSFLFSSPASCCYGSHV